MNKIKISERKNVFFRTLSPYLESMGYMKYLKGDDPTFVLKKEKVVISFYFNFFSSGEIGVSSLFLTHYDIEESILDVGIPTNKLIEQTKKKQYHLPTVSLRQLPDSIHDRALNTIDEIEVFAKLYIAFLEKEGSAFIDKYSYLPNVLIEMDRLELEGQDWNVILNGMGDRLIRGLIIAKLCNDPKYSNKFEYCDKKFTTVELLKEWLPYWEKYKQLLEKIEPKYNL